MHEETFNQSNDSSVAFPMMLTQLGILPGIKLDRVIIYNCLFIE
jgi:fructose-bisphosphate aldolase class 1